MIWGRGGRKSRKKNWRSFSRKKKLGWLPPEKTLKGLLWEKNVKTVLLEKKLRKALARHKKSISDFFPGPTLFINGRLLNPMALGNWTETVSGGGFGLEPTSDIMAILSTAYRSEVIQLVACI